jgi:hypothetical protein
MTSNLKWKSNGYSIIEFLFPRVNKFESFWKLEVNKTPFHPTSEMPETQPAILLISCIPDSSCGWDRHSSAFGYTC